MTTRELVADCIAQALLDAGVDRCRIHVAASWEELGADPVAVLTAVEARYGVRTRADEVAHVRTVGQAVDFVLGRVAALSRQWALSEAA